MAGNKFVVRSGIISLASGLTETIIQLVPATNVGLRITMVAVHIYGTSPTGDKFNIQLCRQTDNGGGGSSKTPVKVDKDNSDTFQFTAASAPFGSAAQDPATTDILDSWGVHPQDSLFFLFPVDHVEHGSDRIGVRSVTSPSNITVEVVVKGEE